MELQEFQGSILRVTPQLRAFAVAFCCDVGHADDLIETSVKQAFKSRQLCDSRTDMLEWLLTILRNHFYAQHGEMRRANQTVRGIRTAKPAPDLGKGARPAHDEMRRALAGLPHLQREALILVCGTGCSYAETSRIAGCPLGTVRSRVNRARVRLSELLGLTMCSQ